MILFALPDKPSQTGSDGSLWMAGVKLTSEAMPFYSAISEHRVATQARDAKGPSHSVIGVGRRRSVPEECRPTTGPNRRLVVPWGERNDEALVKNLPDDTLSWSPQFTPTPWLDSCDILPANVSICAGRGQHVGRRLRHEQALPG